MSRLSGKVAVITGGAAGIGLAAAKLFVEEGAKVLLVDLNEDALRKAVQPIDNATISYAVADVTQSAQVKQYIRAALEHYGGLDILISNAGIMR